MHYQISAYLRTALFATAAIFELKNISTPTLKTRFYLFLATLPQTVEYTELVAASPSEYHEPLQP